ncbi:prostacyclin synthase [Colletotrichum plurivorum]|uniref:Prostacyclin synthase n=1 Tax=Colletotrichum plurivorum TaxID=2175906 RepID=A0A8H6KT15_9PEZI|nr:prostacyclin synthase [Colletotrichum plurivorum]
MSSLGVSDSFLADHGLNSLWLLLLAAFFLYGGSRITGDSRDPREPPEVKPRIPFIGHIIGVLWHKQDYYRELARENANRPIFTVSMGPQKMYIIKSPQLIQSAMRNKAMSFYPIVAEIAEKIVGYGPNIMELFNNPPTDGSISWAEDIHSAYATLAPGAPLLEMNTYVLNRLSKLFNSVGTDFETVKLYKWFRDPITMAAAGSIFGEKNCVTEDPMLCQNLWDYDAGQSQLLFQPMPSITARKAYNGRANVMKTLRRYFREDYGRGDACAVIKRRVETNRRWGISGDDIADHEFGMLFVSVTNAIPTLFWMMCYVFSNPALVTELREEALKVIDIQANTVGETDRKTRRCTLTIANLQRDCPLLVSTYKETMRVTNRQMGMRRVMEDTVITYTPTGESGESAGAAQTYLLKKGTNIQAPCVIAHFLPEAWGVDAEQFDARRFLAADKEQNRAFNPFGGGRHRCPGRFFADSEILGTLATLVLGFEIETPEGGRIAVPEINNSLTEAIAKPVMSVQENMMARIRRRPGWEDVEWAYVASNGRV